MALIHRVIIPKSFAFSKKTAASYSLPKFKESLIMAAGKGKIDTATALEHVHRANTYAQNEQHAKAARYIDDVRRTLGLNKAEHTFETEHKLR